MRARSGTPEHTGIIVPVPVHARAQPEDSAVWGHGLSSRPLLGVLPAGCQNTRTFKLLSALQTSTARRRPTQMQQRQAARLSGRCSRLTRRSCPGRVTVTVPGTPFSGEPASKVWLFVHLLARPCLDTLAGMAPYFQPPHAERPRPSLRVHVQAHIATPGLGKQRRGADDNGRPS